MKYCKKCHILYSSELPCCPKCNPALEQAKAQQDEHPAEKADPALVRRQWLWLCIGIPLFILLLYAVAYIMKSLGA